MRVQCPRLVTLYPSEPSASRTLTACRSPPSPLALNAEPRHIPDLTHIDQEAKRRDVVTRCHRTCCANQLNSRTLTPRCRHTLDGSARGVSAKSHANWAAVRLGHGRDLGHGKWKAEVTARRGEGDERGLRAIASVISR
ncbi:hypothetical protein Zmor_025705 [Zophobas morio]|uniref:Uncharacterized protein n=1 Tax=Zophobas morio TaxID=2755281 RepID=A0AA38HSE0_9CUCU|nr:hypothetical protein Zmor_025705 [Zophobas morio]